MLESRHGENVEAMPPQPPPRTAGPPGLPSPPVTVEIAGGEMLTRLGLRSVLGADPDVTVVGEAADGRSAVELGLRTRPRVLIIDAQADPPDAIATIATFHARLPQTQVIVFAAHFSDDLIFRSLSAGAVGILLRDCAPQDFVNGVLAVSAGQAVLAPYPARRLVDQLAGIDVDRARRAQALVDGLTDREREVLGQMAQGLGNQEIARALYMSEGAVKAHISRILTRLRCTNRVQAVIVQRDARLPH
jgi:DNA-binding NarL/FixJ family response regulator